jgi:hypothetical protein
MPFYVSVGSRSILFRVGMIWTGLMGAMSYWWTNRHRPSTAMPRLLSKAMTEGQALDDSRVLDFARREFIDHRETPGGDH